MPDHGNAQRSRRPQGRFWAWLLAAAILIALDQVTKLYFDSQLQYGQRLAVLQFFDFTLLYNPGAAFSFLAEGEGWQRWLFTAIALGAAGLITHLLWRNPRQIVFCSALTAILAGAIGNLIDRIQHGHVIDFLLFYWNGWHFPAFNIADICITCGAILLILDEILRIRRERRKNVRSVET